MHNIKLEDYMKNNKLGIDVIQNKYLMKNESIYDSFVRITSELVKFEKNKSYQDKWIETLWEGWWRPGGSIWSTIGNNEYPNQSTANCTGISCENDSLEGIIKEVGYYLAKCAAYRQGVGVVFSKLRPKGTKINNSAKISSGSLHWMDFWAHLAGYVGQSGRIPALLFALSIEHPDIIDFITIKDNLENIQNANLSIHITDEFMEVVKNDKNWDLKYNGKIFKTLKGKDLFRMISEHAWKTGEPGLQFIDEMNRYAMQPYVGYKISTSNACSEKPLPNFSVCNLANINLGKLTISNYPKELKKLVPLVVRFLDDVVEYELVNKKSPLPQQRHVISQLREIGVGITNIHKLLFDNQIPYDSDEAIRLIEDISKYIALYTFEESHKLSLEKGTAPSFSSNISNSPYYQICCKELNLKIPTLRNMSHCSVAPVGSVSLTYPEGSLSSGIEPAIGFAYWRKTRVSGSYEWYFVLPEATKNEILKQNLEENERNFITNINESVKDESNEIGKSIISIMKKYGIDKYLKGTMEIDPFKKLEMISRVQKWVDAGISTTFNLPENFTIDKIEQLYETAYDKKIKAITVYRLGSRDDIMTLTPPKEKLKIISEIKRPDTINLNYAPKRPKSLPCDIHRTVVKGEKWVVLIGLLDNKPYEVFAGKYENIDNIPTTATKGKILKIKSGHYNLHIKTNRLDVTIDKLSNTLTNNNSEQNALTRALSTQLRHGVPVSFIIDQLNKSEGSVVDFSKAIARVLKKYQDVIDNEKIKSCPLCGGELNVLSGCPTCLNCGWSKCG